VLARNSKRAAGGDHIVDQLLGDRDVALPGDRWVRAIDSLEVLAAGCGDLRLPRRPTPGNRDQTAVTQRGRRDAVQVVFEHAVRAAVGYPTQEFHLLLAQCLPLRHANPARSHLTLPILAKDEQPRHTAKTRAKTKGPVSRAFKSGSDGTRTRDLRRDRPVMALPG
jgi:hypothetical protein